MKILVVSDEEVPYIWDHFDKARFNDIELIISCGDLKAEYLSFLVTMLKAPLFYVHGNHDTNYEKKPPEGCQSIDGKLVRFNGIRIVGLGGSNRYNTKAHQYTDEEMSRRISRLSFKLWLSKGFDILVSHAPAYKLGDGDDLCHMGFASFVTLLDKYSPKYFFHGHQHLCYGNHTRTIKYKDTTIINAHGYHIVDYT